MSAPSRSRRVVVAGVAAAATAAGVGWSLWRPGARGNNTQAALWSLRFERPNGQVLSLAALRGQALVLNFWATWCPPCVREMPALDRFQRDFGPRGWRVVGLAVDSAAPVREFLARTPVSFDIGLAGVAGIALSRQFGNHHGGLPFTALFDRAGTLRVQQAGESRYEWLASWAHRLT